MCIDFKNLNSSCPKDYYPLPEIDSKIEAVMGYSLKCFLDAYKGYHQVQMSEEDEEKTAIYTDQGTFCYKKMSFGLKNAGAIYQRLVDEAFDKQIRWNLEVYVDDMVIKSKAEKDMLADIAETFDNLRRINMKLNPKKCSFGVEEGKFLGYMVTSEGIRANPAKTRDIAEITSPRMWGEMQSLAGKLAALNRFLARSAEKSLPFFETLKNITKENKEDYRWTEGAEKAFQELKKTILNLPTLTIPIPEENFPSRRRKELRPIGKVSTGAQKCIKKVEKIFRGPSNYGHHEQPIKQILGRAETSGRLAQYAVELGAYKITYEPRNSIKGQAEYEALLAGMRIAKKMGVQALSVKVDSKLVASQINGYYDKNIPRNQNQKADVLSKLASVTFNHLTKEILVETLDTPSMDCGEINAIVEEEGENWMSPIIRCLEEGIWPKDEREARALRMRINQYVMEEGYAHEAKISSGTGNPAGILLANNAQRCKGRDTQGIDVLGPLPEAPGKVKYVIVAIDYFTKWIEAKPLARTTGKEVKKFVWDNIVFAHPQANGLVERANRSLMEGIKTRLGRERKCWVDELPNILWAHRTSLKTSNGETPYSLTFGSEAVIPAEVGMPTYPTMMIKDGKDNEEEIRLNLDLLTERREAAAIREARYKMKLE
ncbi:reverse transcriptase domain-containing protein [Tanacetum coccineum]